MLKLIRTTGITLLLLTNSSAFAGFEDNYDQIAIVLAKADEPVRKPIKDFYIKAYSDFSKQKKWTLANQDQVYKALRNGAVRSSLIPTIARHDLVASLATKRDDEPSDGHIIGNLQRALDTLALKGAVIVDCETDQSFMIKGCALYYYDRTKAKIYASVSKTFAVPVSDASVWASPLSASLQEGLAARAREDEQNKVDQLLAAAEENAQGRKHLSLIATASSEPLRSGSWGSKSHLVGSIAPMITKEQSSVGLDLGVGKASDTDVTTQSRHAGLLVNTYVRAMDHARWELSFAAGGAERQIDVRDEGSITQRSAFARIEPGLSWELLDGMTAGMSLRYAKFFGGSNTTTGDLEGAQLSASSLGFGINLRCEF